MNPSPVTLVETTLSKLSANGDPVPVCNPAGEVVGYYVSPDYVAQSDHHREVVNAMLDRLFPPEEIARIVERSKNDPRPRRSMDEVLRMVEGN